MNKRKRILTLLINGVLLSSLCVASAADTTTGSGNGIAYGTGSNAPKAENVAIGNNASISYSNGASASTGDIVVGSGAKIDNYASQGGSVAIGKNAQIDNMAGGQEANFAFGQTTYSGSMFSSSRIPADPTKVVGTVVIGDNTFARTGGTMVGSHNYKGALGDTDVDSSATRNSAIGVYTTTVGANSFSNGAFTTNTGTYNIISSEYNGGRMADIFSAAKNLGATVTGTLNSIESKTASNSQSGVANAITGVANRTFNSNGSLIYGAGNEISNSVGSLSDLPTDSGNSAKDFADKLRNAVTSSNGAGATMAFGGGNKADYTLRTSMIGVNNTVTGVRGNQSKDNLAIGVGNTGTKVQHMTVIGSKNTVSDANNTLVLGDNHTVTGANHTLILGSSDNGTTTTVNDAVAVGHNTEVSVVGGTAIGSGSKATVAAGAVGYDVLTNAPSTKTSSTWVSTASAVSVGDVDNNVTRQITSVAAGTNDTDAVNVAQLKLLRNNVGGDITNIQNNITNINGNIARLDKRVNRGVAGAAALAALHPLDFDPDAKWDFAAGYGHYHNGNAAALGAFYRPNEDVQLSVGSTLGNGETVVNAGLSVKVGAHSNVSRSRVAIGKEVLELKKTVALQNAQIQKLTALLNDVAGTRMKADHTTLFPDVASNHWAYEAVSDLSRRGLVEGYPDGTFGGDRLLTRYEFAQIVYRALQNGVQVDEQLVTEFSPEMALFRVDTVAKNHQGQPTIERVRVNKK